MIWTLISIFGIAPLAFKEAGSTGIRKDRFESANNIRALYRR